MEELKHFSHEEHPLFLIEDVHRVEEAAEKPMCYGCGMPIMSDFEVEPTYSCRECSSFFLHKRCAELPRVISHPLHSKHTLVLLPLPLYQSNSCLCDACDQEWSRFTYHCSSCNFDVDISCAEVEIDIPCAFAERKFEHPSHRHPMVLQRRQALFACNACGEKDTDQSYLCTTCSFWIHRKCALLPRKNRREDHDHPFSLAYNLPIEYLSYDFECYVCRKRLHPRRWVYYCGPCRYFVHLKCFAKDVQPLKAAYETANIGDGQTNTEATENSLQQFGAIEYLFQDPIRLPTFNFDNIIRPFVKQQGCKNNDLFVHCSSQNKDDEKQHLPIFHINLKSTAETRVPGQEIICDCCIQSIDLSGPFYECGNCKYFFHSSCLKLPATIHHPCHLEHSLQLLKLAKHASTLSRCDVCGQQTNGTCYSCESCKFYVDVKCASLPGVIMHEAHRHPLYFMKSERRERCSACDYDYSSFFRCELCSFNLDYECAQLPAIVKHRWDRHFLTLSFPPYSDHPDEFWCVMCEKEIHPNLWLYHCRECDTSFHPWCNRGAGCDRNIKFGQSIRVGNHPQHPLLMVCEASFYSSCATCNEDLNDRISFVSTSAALVLKKMKSIWTINPVIAALLGTKIESEMYEFLILE